MANRGMTIGNCDWSQGNHWSKRMDKICEECEYHRIDEKTGKCDASEENKDDCYIYLRAEVERLKRYILDIAATEEIAEDRLWCTALLTVKNSETGTCDVQLLLETVNKLRKEKGDKEQSKRQEAFNKRIDRKMAVIEKLKNMGYSDEEIREVRDAIRNFDY